MVSIFKNDRAQQIREKRLNGRKALKKKIEDDAKKMHDWLLDLIDTSTEYRCEDEDILYLDREYNNMAKVGQNTMGIKEGSSYIFSDERVLKKVAKKFNKKWGYSGQYLKIDSDRSRVIIRIK